MSPRSERLMVSPSLADACPSCPPGHVAAAAPESLRVDAAGYLCAGYTCPACGKPWRTWWELAGAWPLWREAIDPAAEVRALLGELIAVLADALANEELDVA